MTFSRSCPIYRPVSSTEEFLFFSRNISLLKPRASLTLHIAILAEHLLRAWHCPELFTHVTSFHSHNPLWGGLPLFSIWQRRNLRHKRVGVFHPARSRPTGHTVHPLDGSLARWGSAPAGAIRRCILTDPASQSSQLTGLAGIPHTTLVMGPN